MIKTNTNINLTKDFILDNITEEEIILYFTGEKVQYKTFIYSPFRQEKNPSCRFFKNTKIVLHDFGGDFHGDCFDIIMRKYTVSFIGSLELVYNNILKGRSQLNYSPSRKRDDVQNVEELNIQIEIREYNDEDLEYWQQYNITKDILSLFNVFACQTIWKNNNIIYRYNKLNPAYSYYEWDEKHKIYFPKTKNFITNIKQKHIIGLDLLESLSSQSLYNELYKPFLIITKSKKDVMCLFSFGISAIAPQSETVVINKEVIDALKIKYKLYTLFDYDLAGVRLTNKMKKLYDIPYIFIKEKIIINNKNIRLDISDYNKIYGFERTKQTIEKLLTNI